MERIPIEDIRGEMLRKMQPSLSSVLNNEPSPFLETTVLNAGLGFYANGKVDSIRGRSRIGRQVIASGKAIENSDYYRSIKMSQEFLARIPGAKGA